MKDEVLKPVFMSVVDGLLEATAGGRAARKKGLTASRVLQECERFSYNNEPNNGTYVNGYTEYKNAKEFDDVNPNMTQQYNGESRKKVLKIRPLWISISGIDLKVRKHCMTIILAKIISI